MVDRTSSRKGAQKAPFRRELPDQPSLPHLLLQCRRIQGSAVAPGDSSVKSLTPHSSSPPACSSCALGRLWISPKA